VSGAASPSFRRRDDPETRMRGSPVARANGGIGASGARRHRSPRRPGIRGGLGPRAAGWHVLDAAAGRCRRPRGLGPTIPRWHWASSGCWSDTGGSSRTSSPGDSPPTGGRGGAHRLLEQVSGGMDWRAAAGGLFGRGSFGNGSAMRVAPLGILGGSGRPRSRGRQDAETPGRPGSPLMLGGRMQRWPGGLGLAGGS